MKFSPKPTFSRARTSIAPKDLSVWAAGQEPLHSKPKEPGGMFEIISLVFDRDKSRERKPRFENNFKPAVKGIIPEKLFSFSRIWRYQITRGESPSPEIAKLPFGGQMDKVFR